MARDVFSIEKGLRILKENLDAGQDNSIDILFGSGVPGGDAGEQDAAFEGSLYLNTDNTGDLRMYAKVANAGATADWELIRSAQLWSVIGVAVEAADMGTFTGSTLSDNQDIKTLLQELETAVESITGDVRTEQAGVTAAVTLDSIGVDGILACEWEIHAREDASPANVKVFKLIAVHDGTAVADASGVDDSVFARLKLGSNFNTDLSVDLDGVGAAQEMRLRVSSSSAGVTYTARRTTITAP